MILQKRLFSRTNLFVYSQLCFYLLLSSPVSAQLRVWANEGGDKVTQEELRATNTGNAVYNSVWKGSRVELFGAKNEVVAFNLVLESPTSAINNVSVQFDKLTGPGGATISSRPTTSDGVFDWQGRNIELFYVKYLQIKGLSTNTFSNYDERHTPERIRRPFTGPGYATGTWYDRPDHDKFYPDIAVPLEVNPTFPIAARSNQSIWADVYIPKNAVAGVYSGVVRVLVNGSITNSIPVELTVRNFSLPDMPSAKTMLMYSPYEVNERYFGNGYINPLGSQGPASIQVRQRHFMVAHRHKLSLIDTNYEYNADQPAPYEWPTRLDGSLFTPANGYDGPGVATGNNVFAIGVYGSWTWKWQGQAAMWQRTNNWEQWFQNNSPNTERFLYLDDESHDYAQLQQWADWAKSNPGIGKNLPTLATVDLPKAVQAIPSLTFPASTIYLGDPAVWGSALSTLKTDPKKRFFSYNGHRPAAGSFATEDDGVALRELAWGQYKMKVDRWYFWQSTYYHNTEGATGQTNVFRQAQTFGTAPTFDSAKGMTSRGYSNGDGILFYPGKDQFFPSDSYNINGPMASLRMKHWRRGIQDVDYLALANSINPNAVKQIMDAVLPTALWEYGVDDVKDPTWKRGDISWSNDPDVWEQARASLASIIETGSASIPTPSQTVISNPSTIPSAPSNLNAVALTSNQLVLTWNDTSSNETGFKLERSIDGVNFSEIASLSANSSTYNDNGLNAWTTYAYRIRAVNGSNTSAYSPYVYRTTLTTSGPVASTPVATAAPLPTPFISSISAIISNQLVLNWSDTATNETGYKIERSMDGVNFNQVASLGADVTSFIDTGLNAWTTYAYRIRSYNSNSNSAYSPYAYKTTLTTNVVAPVATVSSAVTAPSSLTGYYSGNMQATLSWKDNSNNESGFRIERSTDGTNFTTVTNVSTNSDMAVISGLARWTTYVFRVRSYGTTVSTPSNPIYISTPQ